MATHAGAKFYVCTTPQPEDLTASEFETLTYVEVKGVGSVGERGTATNIVSYDELATEVTQKGKGISNAGDPPIECRRIPSDPGQVAMRAAALTRYQYAFKLEYADAPDEDTTNTVCFNRGLVTGPTTPAGRNEDFILEVYTLALNQREVIVNPEAIVP
jgi:hypothetical protein